VNPTANSCQLLRTDLSGTTTVLHALSSTRCQPDSLAVSEANVYFGARDQTIWWVPKLASTRASVLYTEPSGYPDRFTMAGSNLFFLVAAGAQLKRIYADGTGLIQVTIPYLADFVAFGDQLYFAANDQVARVDMSLANQTMVMPVQNGTTAYTSLAVDANDVYISTRGLGYICRAMPGANASCATYDGIDAVGVALAPDVVYVTAYGGTVHRADRPPPFVPSWALLANSGGCGTPGSPVVVGDHVYWLCNDSVLRTPR
jgi:hypothetical protein